MEPRIVLPSLNVTVPPGVPVPAADAVTVAVSVTACPDTDGLALDVSPTLVATGWGAGPGAGAADVGASRPCASVASGAAVAVLFSRGRPYISSIVRSTL